MWPTFGHGGAPTGSGRVTRLSVPAHRHTAIQWGAALVKLWESGYGNLRQKVADYLAQPERLKEIKVAYGTGDTYKWIPAGAKYFLGLLQENGIPSSSHVFGGARTVDNFFFDEDCVAFFSKNLTS